MAEWNLSVELRGQGNDLAKKLRKAATEAQLLSAAASDAQDEVRQLGTTSTTTAKAVKKLGTSSQTATERLLAMAAEAKAAAKDFRKLERALKRTDEQVRAMADSVRITAELDDQTATGIAAINTAIADLQALSPIRLTADLDDQTATGLAGVRAAVDDLHLLSPINLTADLDDQTATGLAGVRTAVNDLQSLSPVDLTVNFTGNSADITAAATAMGDLRDRADSAQTALADLTTQAAAAAPALNLVQQEAQDLSRALRTLRGRAAAAADALDDLNVRAVAAATGIRTLGTRARTANGHLTTLSGNTRTLRGDLDDLDGSLTRVTGRMGGLRGSLGTVSSSSNSASGNSNNLKQALIGLATALIPVASAVVPIAAGMAAAGAAVGAFGVAVAGQIKALTESADAEEKYQKAVREHGKASTEAATAEKEYLRTISEMPPATREAAAQLAVLKDQYKDWSNALAGDTMPVVTKGMALFGSMLPRLTPLVKGASKELDRLMNVAAGGMRTPGFDRFVASFTQFANESLARGTSALIRFTQALNTGKVGGSLREFLDYAHANGPLVADTLGNLSQALIHLLVAASDMGVSVLTAVNALAKLVNAVPASVLSVFLQLYTAFKLVTLGAAALGAVTGSAAVARLGAYFAVMRAAGVATTLRATAASMSMMTKAAIGLGVLAVAAVGIGKLAEKARGAPPDVDRLTTSLKELAVTGKMTGEFKKTFGDVDGLVKKMGELGKAAKDNDEYVKSFGNSGIGPLDDLRKKANDLWQDFTKGDKSITALKDDFGGLDEAMAGMVSSGYGKQAASDFSRIQAAAKKAGYSTKEIADLFPKYQDAVAAAAAEQKLAAAGMGLFGQQALDTKAKLDAQKASADGLRASIVALNDVNRAALGGMIGFEAGIDAAAKAAKENAGSLRMVNGELDLNSPKAQAAATALADLGAKTDAATTAARDSGRSWEYVNGIYQRGEQAIIKNAMAMGLSKAEAKAFAATVLTIPDKKSTVLEMRTEDAIAGLNAVISKIKATPGAKSVTVKALTADAVSMLERLGFRVEHMKDGRFKVTALTGEAAAGLAGLQRQRDGLRDKTIRLTTIQTTVRRTIAEYNTIGRPQGGEGGESKYADGGIVRAANGLFVPGYAPRQDTVPAILSPGEGVLVPETVRKLGAATGKGGPGIIKALNMWGRYGGAMAFADGGTVPQRFASGGVSYTPDGLRRDTSAVQSSYSNAHQPITKDEYLKKVRAQKNAVDSLRSAEARLSQVRRGKHTHAQLVAAETRVSKARRSVATATDAARTAEARYKKQFSLSDWQKTLKSAVSANASWESNLNKIASRGGGDVIDQLRGMGEEGAAMVSALAKASKKQFNDIVANLKKLGPLAKASLADYTKQLNASSKTDSTFQANLAKLAGMGYGDLATQLAGQGDDAAKKLAAEAATSKSKASAANTAAKKAGAQLSGDELSQLVQIIAAVKTSKTGIHDVAGTTGLGEDDIIATATKASAQIKSSLGSRATKFLGDLARANKGLSYANGGIREGIYATQGGAVTFAEPSTGGEAYIPLGPNKRAAATNVLRDVAGRFGVGLTDVSATRPVVIVQGGGDTNVNVTAVRTGATASDIGTQVGRSVRRARRGGVNARAAA